MNVFIYIVALFYFSMGICALVSPRAVVGYFGIDTQSADAKNEVRAVYGGFGVAIAGVLLASLFLPQLRQGIIIAVATGMSGVAFGRVVSALMEKPGRWPVVFFFVEVVVVLMLILGL